MDDKKYIECLPDINISEANKGVMIFLKEIGKRIMIIENQINTLKLKGINAQEAKIILGNVLDDYEEFTKSAAMLSFIIKQNV